MSDGRLMIAPEVVRKMLDEQFPEWRDLSVRRVEQDGWDNNTFRLGNELKARLPSAAGYVPQVEKEFNWLPKLAKHLPVTVPEPVALGKPTADYPYPWSVYRWIEGETASAESIRDMNEFARDLAAFLHALWAADTTGAPEAGDHNCYRGGDLSVYDEETRFCLSGVTDLIDADAALMIWEQALRSKWEKPAVWVQGDLSNGNILTRDGRLSAVIDFGLCTVGDPACDLVITWKFFSGVNREIFKTAVNIDQNTWDRAIGWALWKAVRTLYYARKDNIAEEQREAKAVIEVILSDAKLVTTKT
ncbi:aminoglycoside phosphotransferase family protein [Pseudovibrio sp. Ad37]|uniref:aminoglycoside phosphotransferase family protein n=1 Tax=Pseudovibrio sp. Ad37 TaxID=989422 RepID=UPI0007AE970B|nr:aminoglycoside phosphotransferase family protein [Pseudovibrio sp. Ad37]KZL25806.1 Phosphotransferase enzyme family protein [Pseudovibrio sp. Ad37]